MLPFVTAVCLFISIVSTPRTRKLALTKDGDYKRGIPQMDITGHGHEDQMFAVKVRIAYIQ